MVIQSEALTPNQAARRSRVIDAAMALAAEGGYDAVQMRDVATRAQVALGTIYRYFSSKDHLLAACQVELWHAQVEHFSKRAPDSGTPADRVVGFLSRAMQRAASDPERTAALITASSAPDPAVRECQLEIMAMIDGVLVDAMGRDIDAERRKRIAITLRQLWFSWLLNWVNGWNDAATVSHQLESATRLLLD
ncbi:MAG: TetR/AcrR family transcriptional regulator [Actinobacteria bacterium]|nr:TetR/AcrR family transcriptional regulator [Actinomycetota bacterium]